MSSEQLHEARDVLPADLVDIGTVVDVVEERHPHACRRPGPDGEGNATVRNLRPKSRFSPPGRLLRHQVMTLGLLRPVWLRMPAMSSAASMA